LIAPDGVREEALLVRDLENELRAGITRSGLADPGSCAGVPPDNRGHERSAMSPMNRILFMIDLPGKSAEIIKWEIACLSRLGDLRVLPDIRSGSC